MRRLGLLRLHENEEGVTAVIVVLCLVALMGMLVLVIDVGGLLYKRRELVSGSDAAALAAAKTCAVPTSTDPSDPEGQADLAAMANVNGLIDSNGRIIAGAETCRSPRGYVTVEYSYPQQLFFAGVFGASTKTVTTQATAAWGPLGGGNAVPIVLESSVFQGPCPVPDLDPQTKCNFWYNNGPNAIGGADWGFLSLDQWDVAADANCNSAGGTSSLNGYILNNYGSEVLLADPGPTYVCVTTGHRDNSWQDALQDRLDGVGCDTSPCPGPVILMPVNDCAKQVDKNGNVTPCGSGTPDKFAIVGFVTLELSGIYKGNDPRAIGTPGTPAQSNDCGNNGQALGNSGAGDSALGSGQAGGWDLRAFAVASCGAPASPDVISGVTVDPPQNKDPALVACASVPPSGSSTPPAPTGCDYYFNPSTNILSWWDVTSKNVANKVKFNWTINGTPPSPGLCGVHAPDPNAICLQTTWLGYTDQNGTVGNGPSFGTQGHVLCDFDYNSCPANVRP